jgi:hypothetical protein
VQLPVGTEFTLTATAKVNSLAANNQVSFGLMARDDMYIDSYISSTMGDYVAVGTRNQGAVNCFGRKSTALYNGPDATKVYGAGDEIELKLVGTSDGFTLTYGENETVSAGFDYALTAIDPDYIYVGFYVIRNADVTFSNVCLTVKESADNGEGGEEDGGEEDGGDQPGHEVEGNGNNTGLIVAGTVAAAAVVGGVVLAKNWSKLPVHMVSGIVTNGTENNALRDVTITLLKDGKVVRTVTTGLNGSYRMFVAQGEYTLQASYTDPTTGKTVTTSQTLEAPAKNISLVLAA